MSTPRVRASSQTSTLHPTRGHDPSPMAYNLPFGRVPRSRLPVDPTDCTEWVTVWTTPVSAKLGPPGPRRVRTTLYSPSLLEGLGRTPVDTSTSKVARQRVLPSRPSDSSVPSTSTGRGSGQEGFSCSCIQRQVGTHHTQP